MRNYLRGIVISTLLVASSVLTGCAGSYDPLEAGAIGATAGYIIGGRNAPLIGAVGGYILGKNAEGVRESAGVTTYHSVRDTIYDANGNVVSSTARERKTSDAKRYGTTGVHEGYSH